MEILSFVIPCYGSEKTIEPVIREIIEVVSKKADEFEYEIIAVNDSSPDQVLKVLSKLAQDNKKIKVIDFAKNFGKHSAVMAGYSFAKGDYIISLDDDGQCPMDRLWDLLEPVKNGYDVSMAEYVGEKKRGSYKTFGSSVNSKMSESLLDKPKNLRFSNFNILQRFVIEEMLRYNNPFPYLEGLILRTTHRIATVPMEERNRIEGRGYYTIRKSLSLFLNGFTAFSARPLRIATIVGLILTFLGIVFGLYVVIHKLLSPEVYSGYSSTMAVMLFIGGAIMVMLGLIGEYIGRIYISLNNSPQYVIRETTNIHDAERFTRP